MEKLGIPSTIQAAGVSRADFEGELEAMAAAALADRCTATNPRACSLDEIRLVFQKAFAGKLP